MKKMVSFILSVAKVLGAVMVYTAALTAGVYVVIMGTLDLIDKIEDKFKNN